MYTNSERPTQSNLRFGFILLCQPQTRFFQKFTIYYNFCTVYNKQTISMPGSKSEDLNPILSIWIFYSHPPLKHNLLKRTFAIFYSSLSCCWVQWESLPTKTELQRRMNDGLHSTKSLLRAIYDAKIFYYQWLVVQRIYHLCEWEKWI